MGEQDGGTFLEDFVSSTELLPNTVRRNFELMRELDRDASDATKDYLDAEKKYIKNLILKRSSGSFGDNDLWEDIKTKRQRAKLKTDEKVAIAEQSLELVESFVRKLDTDLAVFENILRGSGEFEALGAEPGQDVAVQLDAFERDWIIGRVIRYHQDSGFYDIADADDSKRYYLPESQVCVLDLPESSKKLSKGEQVYAVYPDTTAFYQATVSQALRRSAMSAEPTAVVQFVGDADETGQTPHRVIPLRYVMRLPV